MAELEEQAPSAGRRHIIERPRLTRLLDETSASVIMLVAPAGYGKTTLARQWLANHPHAWYGANSAPTDVAALGLGLINAGQSAGVEIGDHFREWLHTRRGSEDPKLAADLLADDSNSGPMAIGSRSTTTTACQRLPRPSFSAYERRGIYGFY